MPLVCTHYDDTCPIRPRVPAVVPLRLSALARTCDAGGDDDDNDDDDVASVDYDHGDGP